MDFSKFRSTGELSDITVTVNGKEFKLHKFPLFIKSDFFRALARSQLSEKEGIQLEDFPGGPDTFELVANYCYNVKIDITKKNACKLRCAAEFLQMNSPGNLASVIDRFLQDTLTSAKLSRNLTGIIDLALQCEELGPIAEQAKIVDKCLLAIVDCWLLSTKFTKRLPTDSITSDRESFDKLCQLPLNWFLQLFVAARDKSVKPTVLANMVQMYISNAMDKLTPKKKKKTIVKKQKIIVRRKTIKKVKKEKKEEPEPEGENETDESKAESKAEVEEKAEPEEKADDDAAEKDKDCDQPDGDKEEEDKEDKEESEKEDNTKEVRPDDGEAAKTEEEEEDEYEEIEVDEEVEEEVEVEEEIEEEEEIPEGSNEEADNQIREILDTLLLELPENTPLAETISPQWAATMLSTAEKLDCKCRGMLLKLAGRLLHRFSPEDLASFTPTVLSEIVEESCKDSSHVDPGVTCRVIDSYLLALAEKNELNVDVFTKMVSSVPRDKRTNHDTLFVALEWLLTSEAINVTEEEKQELMETVDFSRLSESTLQRAYDSQLVPGSYITKAALALCAKLRSELDTTRAIIKSQDEQLAKFGMGTYTYTPAASTWRPSHETVSIPLSKQLGKSSSRHHHTHRHHHHHHRGPTVPTLASDYELHMALDNLDRNVDRGSSYPSSYPYSSEKGYLTSLGDKQSALSYQSYYFNDDYYDGDRGYDDSYAT